MFMFPLPCSCYVALQDQYTGESLSAGFLTRENTRKLDSSWGFCDKYDGFQLGAIAVGGLAAIFASNAQRNVGNINQRLGDNDDDLSALQARIGNLTDTQRAIQGNLSTLQTTANNAATPAQLMTPATAANRANMQIEDICRNVSDTMCI